MSKRLLAFACWLVLSTLLYSGLVHASSSSYWLLGVVGQAETSRLDVSSIETGFFPYIAWESDGFHIGIDDISYEFGPRDDIRWSVIANPRYALDSESPRFDALERDFALEVGAGVSVGFYPWELSATAVSDVSGSHGGQSLTFAVVQELPLGPGEIEFEFAVEYQSEKLAMHLYGISADEATSDLASFNPGSVWKPSIAVAYFLELGERVGAQMELELSTLPSDVLSSERISETFQADAYIAVVRQF